MLKLLISEYILITNFRAKHHFFETWIFTLKSLDTSMYCLPDISHFPTMQNVFSISVCCNNAMQTVYWIAIMTGLLSPFFPLPSNLRGQPKKHESVRKEMSAFVQHNKFQKQAKKQLKSLTLQRQNDRENWGFSVVGGWDQGQWIGKIFKLPRSSQNSKAQ